MQKSSVFIIEVLEEKNSRNGTEHILKILIQQNYLKLKNTECAC